MAVEWTPEFWLFGFLLTVYSNDWKTGLALTFIYEYAINLFALHATDATDAESATALLYEATVVHASSTFFGALVGIAFVYATDFPKLIDLDVFYSDPQRNRRMNGSVQLGAVQNGSHGDQGTPWRAKPYLLQFVGLVISIGLLYAAILLFAGFYTSTGDLSQTSSNVIGGILIAIAICLCCAYCAVLVFWPSISRYPDGHVQSGRLNFKYSILVALLLATAALYDYTTTLNDWVRFLLHIGGALIVYSATVIAGRFDRYLGSESAIHVITVYLLIFVIHLSLYIGAPVVKTLLSGTIDEIFIWVGAWSAMWIVALVAVGCVTRQAASRAKTLEARDNRRSSYFALHIGKESLIA